MEYFLHHSLRPLVWCHWPLASPARSITDNWELEDLTLWPSEPSHSHYCSVPPVENTSDSVGSVALEFKIKVMCSDAKPISHQDFSPGAGPTSAERFLLEDLGLPSPWQRHEPLRSGLDCADFCTTVYDRDQNVFKAFTPKLSLSSEEIIFTSRLELYLGNAFLAVHLDLLAQLLLVLMPDIGILRAWDFFGEIHSGECAARTGLTGLRSGRIRSCTHQCRSFPTAGMKDGLSTSFRTECNRVRKVSEV